MKSAIRNLFKFAINIKRFLKEIQMLYFGISYLRTFGQLGEDAVIRNHIEWLGLNIEEKGAYLDIGCHHPWIGSNTFKFYKNVQCGYVVDVGNEKQRLWKRFRPNDYFINTAVVPNNYSKEFVIFNLGSKYGKPTDHIEGQGIVSNDSSNFKINAKATKAKDICSIVLSNPKWEEAKWRILDIDVEGLDYEILTSLDLKQLKPDIVAIESFPPLKLDYQLKIDYYLRDDLIVKHLKTLGYSLQSICGPTLIFIRIKSKKIK